MPKVPVVSEVSVNRAPDQYQRTEARDTSASYNQALSGFGKAVSSLGEDFMQAQNEVNQRDWAVKRSDAITGFQNEVRDLYAKEQTEGSNFADPAAFEQYSTKVKELRTKYLSEHGGDGTSRARLDLALRDDENKWTSQAYVTGRQSQLAKINDQVGNMAASFAQKATENPANLPNIIQEFEGRLKDYDAAMTPQQLQAMHTAGMQTIVGSGLERHLTLGDLEGAKKLMAEAGVMLDPKQQLEFNSKIMALDGQVKAKEAAKAATYARLADAGVDVKDPKVALAIETGLVLPAEKKTLAGEIAEIEKIRAATGQPPLTSEDIDILTGIRKKRGAEGEGSGVFGSGAQGRAHEYTARNWASFANNTLGAEGDSLFLESVVLAARPDRFTGQPGYISPLTREALSRRGFDLRQIVSGANIPGMPAQSAISAVQGGQPAPQAAQQAPQAQGSLEQPIPQITAPSGSDQGALAPKAKAPKDTPPEASLMSIDRAVEVSEQNKDDGGLLKPGIPLPQGKIFDMTSKLTGPVSSFRTTIGRIPLIGGVVDDPEARQARKYAETLGRDLVTVLQNNPRYAEGERQQIQQDVSLIGKFFDRPEAFQDDLIGLDDSLVVRQQNAIATLKEFGSVSQEQFQQTMNVLNAITKFRHALGVPPVMKSPQDVKQSGLKSGEKYRRRGPNGGWIVEEVL